MIPIPFYTAIPSGIFILCAALGSQYITARANLGRYEAARAGLCPQSRCLPGKAGTFDHDPLQESQYLEYLHSYLAVMLVAPPEVIYLLKNNENGVHIIAQYMRRLKNDYMAMSTIQSGTWLESMEAVTEAMRNGLKSLRRVERGEGRRTSGRAGGRRE